MLDMLKTAAPHADALLATPEGRRGATQLITTNFEHIPAELLAHLMVGAAASPAASALIEHALRERWSIDAERITCPVRIVWGTADRLLPWPGRRRATATTGSPTPTGWSSTAWATARSSTSRSRRAELILGFTAR